MKSLLILGVVLVIAGALVLAYQGIAYTQQKQVAQLGSVHITKKEERTIPLPPALGVVVAGVGAILIGVSVRRS